jgi:two-component system, NtrC family, response regulator GlrR
MDQKPNIQLFDFSRTELLRGELLAILSDLQSEAELQCEFVNNSCDGFEDALIERVAALQPHIVGFVVTLSQLVCIRNVIPLIKAIAHNPEIVLITGECDAKEVLDLLRLGASDFIIPPLTASSTLPLIRRLLNKAKSRIDVTNSLKSKTGMRRLVGEAPSFLAETKKIPLLARCAGRVLILGQSGTGKELFARAIHYLSARMAYPFVGVSCGAIPVELVENEMFGHSRGAFTGATTAEVGLIGEAEGGTLFLDEVDCLPLLAQTKLLRFLQEREYKPLGSSKARFADVRVIAASNIDLRQAVNEQRMRQDLYYRLNVAQVCLPALRDRRSDIPLLAKHFIAKYAHEFDRAVRGLSESAMRKLLLYDWPGNVRELENTIERAVMFTETECIHDIEILLPEAERLSEDESFQARKTKIVTQFEQTYIHQLMLAHHGNVSRAARAAKKNRRALLALIRKHAIDVQSFRNN